MQINQVSLEDTIKALRGGGNTAANAMDSARQGYQRAEDQNIEARKAALQKRIAEAGLMKGSDVGLPAEEAQRELTPEVAGLLIKKNTPVAPKMQLLPPEAVQADIDEHNALMKRLGRAPISGKAILAATDPMQQDKALNRLKRDQQAAISLYSVESGPERAAQADVLKKFQDYQDINAAFQAAVENYNPEYVGPVAGRAGPVEQNLGIDATDQRGKFFAGVAAIRNSVLKARSGGAVTPQEADRVNRELPDQNTAPVEFEARMSRAINLYNSIMAEKKRLARGGLDSDLLAPIEWNPAKRASAPVAAPVAAEVNELEALKAERARRQALKQGR